jgi:hypothetical protein
MHRYLFADVTDWTALRASRQGTKRLGRRSYAVMRTSVAERVHWPYLRTWELAIVISSDRCDLTKDEGGSS